MLLVVLDHDRGIVPVAAWEALTAGRAVAADLEVAVHALAIGEGGDRVAADAAAYGADVVHVATHEILTDFGPEAWGETVAQVVDATGATVVLASGTGRGNEFMAQAAARMQMPMVANCTGVEVGEEQWVLTRVRWGGSLLEQATLASPVKLLTTAPHSTEPTPSQAAGEVRSFQPVLDASLARTVIKDRVLRAPGATLATAPVVIGGGRGVGSTEGFASLEDLADLLDGAIGCSRVATNSGWRPHADQVGQTGTKIAPEIYIACGISGAIQHWVGAMASKTVLAINTDPEANMVAKADYAVIGDLHEVVPAIAAEIRRRRS